MPNLKEPRLQVAIKKDIKAENLEADARVAFHRRCIGDRNLAVSTRLVRVVNEWLSHDHRLNNEIGDRRPERDDVIVALLEVRVELANGSLGTAHCRLVPVTTIIVIN